MIHTTPLLHGTRQLMGDRTRYNRTLKKMCLDLPGSNTDLYVLILRDLLFHFDNNNKGLCRSQISRNNRLWNADSYKTITARLNKRLESKSVSEKTVKRYHQNLEKKGWIALSRHFFAGKNILHRSVCAGIFETAVITARFSNSMDQENQLTQEKGDHLRETADAQRCDDLLSGKPLDGLTATWKERSDMPRVVESTIEYGHLLFGLGRLNETTKTQTQRARARIRLLVEARILGPLFVLCLHEAIEHGEFDSQGVKLVHKFWPNWLDQFYPEKEDITPLDGPAGDYFISNQPQFTPWMNATQQQRFYECQKLFQHFQNEQEAAHNLRELKKEEDDTTAEKEAV